MKELEQKIEEAARIHAKLKTGFDLDEESYYNSHAIKMQTSFMEGAKSPEAKAYWQEGMYSKEDVRQLLIKFKAFLWEREDFSTAMATKWFEQNKKK